MNGSNDYSLNIPKTDKSRLVIIGGGFAGVNLLKNLSDHYQVVLIDRYNYHTFQPLLYQVATAGLEPDAVSGPLRKIIDRKNDVYFRMAKVEKIHPKLNNVVTNVGTLQYDYLAIATGSRINFFGNPEIAQHAFPVKQVTHAIDLRNHIFQQFEKVAVLSSKKERVSYLNFVVVGAGPTGVELCGALAELREHVLPRDYPDLNISDVHIYLVEGLNKVLPGMSEKASRKAQHYLEKMGVQIKLNCLTDSCDGKTVQLNTGESIQTETLIWAAGVKGNIPEGFEKENIHKGKLLVNDFNQLIKNKETMEFIPNVFALGDVAFMNKEGYEKGLPGLAQVAKQQGKHLAKNLNGLVQLKPFEAFEYHHKGSLATVGRNKAVADLPGNITISGFAGWFIWMLVHLLFLIGFRNKAVAIINWSWNYFTYDRSIRLILRPSSKEKDVLSHAMHVEMNKADV